MTRAVHRAELAGAELVDRLDVERDASASAAERKTSAKKTQPHAPHPPLAEPGVSSEDGASLLISFGQISESREPGSEFLEGSVSEEVCANCGKPLPARRKLKTFCSYGCRGQKKAQEDISHRPRVRGRKKASALSRLRALKKQSVGHITSAQVAPGTYRLDAAQKRGVGWLMEVNWPGGGPARFVARVRDWASEPLPFEQARQAASSAIKRKEKGKPRDWIAELNQVAANAVDRAALKAEGKAKGKDWPIDVMGGSQRCGRINPETRRAILETELGAADSAALNGDGITLEYDANGYPELPAFLDRRRV